MQTPALPIIAMPDPDDPNGIEFVGECAEFCAYRTFGRGIPVERHGALCLSEPCGREVDALLADGSELEVSLELARPYRNGTYAVAARPPRADRVVRLTSIRSDSLGAEGEVELFLTPGEGLRLAAELEAAAHRLDQIVR